MMSGQLPRLSYSQLFSFQVAHNLVEAQMAGERYIVNLQIFKDLLKKGEWNRSILEVDFTNAMVFLQDKDKIVAAQPFASFKKFVLSGEDFEDNLISIRFVGQQWQIMTQNSAEKTCLLHLLQCVAKDTSAEEALIAAAPGILGLNKSVLRAGILVRKAKTQFKKNERYCVLVPGKLFMFKNPNLPGQHVRYVTSLMGASVRVDGIGILRKFKVRYLGFNTVGPLRKSTVLQGLEFELLVPGTKTLTFIPDNMEEASGWVGALERSVEIAQQLLAGGTYEQDDEVPNNMFASMNPGTSGGMMAGPSGVGGAFVQTSTHGLGAYSNVQDSRAVQQRIAGGFGGGMVQQSQQEKSFGITTHLNHTTPFGVAAPYGGNFQANTAQGNLRNGMVAGNYQGPGGMLQQGPTSNMPGQAGFMAQSIAGPSNRYNQPQGNFNQLNLGAAGSSQRPQQGWGQGQQIPNALPVETGVKMIRRATQTLREFNNNMDQFLAQPSTSGYGDTPTYTQNPGFGRGAPQSQFQGYGAAKQVQVPGYGRGAPQTQGQASGGPQNAQVMGYPRGAPQTQAQAYGGPQQAQVPEYGREDLLAQSQAYGNPQQSQVPGYGRGTLQTQSQGYGGPQQAQVPGYGRGGPQGQVQGASQAQDRGNAGAQQPQFQGYGRGAPQAQGQVHAGGQQPQFQGYGRGTPQTQGQGYGVAQQSQVQGYGGGASQAKTQNSVAAQQAQVQQAPVYGGGAPQMQAPGYGRGAPQMQSPGHGMAGPMVTRQQYQGPGQGMAPVANSGDWKQFTSPDGRTLTKEPPQVTKEPQPILKGEPDESTTPLSCLSSGLTISTYYYNERTRQTTWTRPY